MQSRRVIEISDTKSGVFNSFVFIYKEKPARSFVLQIDVMDVDFITMHDVETRLMNQFSDGCLKVVGSYYTHEINTEISIADIQEYSPFYFVITPKIKASVDPSLKISEFEFGAFPGMSGKSLFEHISCKTKLPMDSFYLTFKKTDKSWIISRNSISDIPADCLDKSILMISRLAFDKPLVTLKFQADTLFELQVSLENTVRELAELIDIKKKLLSSTIKVIFGNEALERGSKTLKTHEIVDKATIKLLGGIENKEAATAINEAQTVKFVDVENDKEVEKRKWSKSAPKWRIVSPGLNIEGKCTYEACEAKNKWVIINKGIGKVYDVVNDQTTNKCPFCSQKVEAELCAFNNCTVRFSGQKFVGDKPCAPVKVQKEIEFGDFYHRFNPEKSGTVEWKSLKIFTSPLPTKSEERGKDLCPYCGIRILEEAKMLKCGHCYHSDCRSQSIDLKTELTTDCVLCSERNTMTTMTEISDRTD